MVCLIRRVSLDAHDDEVVLGCKARAVHVRRVARTGAEGAAVDPYKHRLGWLARLRLRPHVQREAVLAVRVVRPASHREAVRCRPVLRGKLAELISAGLGARLEAVVDLGSISSESAKSGASIGRALTYRFPSWVLLLMYFSGGAHRSLPSGGFAYGMPKYSDTWWFSGQAARWPWTCPLVVRAVRGEYCSGASIAAAATPEASSTRRLNMVNEHFAQLLTSNESPVGKHQRRLEHDRF
jgi:hypothetical protein